MEPSNPVTAVDPNSTAPSLAEVVGVLLGVAVLWLPVLALHLTPALFAALLTYAATRALAARLRVWLPRLPHSEGLALLCILLVLGLVIAALVDYAADAHVTLPGVLRRMALILDQVRTALPQGIADHVPASVDALREAAANWLRKHAAQVQLWGGHTLRGFGYVIAGLVIGALAVIQLPAQGAAPGASSALAARLRGHLDALVASFSNVVFAQARIATINAVLTAVFLLGVMPLVGRPLPMAGTLVAITFVMGLIPVVGNLISNTVIVIFALSSSLVDAALALAWLVGIHKLEYFLNAHIIGTRIRAQAWELLIAMLVMEAAFGLAGLITAPIIYAQGKHALAARGWLG